MSPLSSGSKISPSKNQSEVTGNATFVFFQTELVGVSMLQACILEEPASNSGHDTNYSASNLFISFQSVYNTT
jgi:hypothetical protein